MSKKKIIILISSLILFLGIGSFVFAEYYFNRILTDGQADLGTITLGNTNYLSYAGEDDNGYTTDRIDSPKVLETSDDLITCYASKKSGYTAESEFISLNQLGFEFEFTATIDSYVRVKVSDSWISRKYYSGSQNAINSIIPKDSRNNYVVTDEVDSTNYSNYYLVNATIALSYDSNTTYYELSSGSYIETSINSDTFSNGTYYVLSITKATSYNKNNIYYYNSNSPFQVSNDGWFYDSSTGYIYYKYIFTGSNDLRTISFLMSDTYYYPIEVVSGYREEVIVNLSFTVDIIQANRAYKKWGIDMETYFD